MVTAVLWLQAGFCFLGWVGYGVWLARSRAAKSLLPISRRGFLIGPVVLILSMALFAGALYWVGTNSGLVSGSLAPWALVVVLIAGLAFVHAQSLGALNLLNASMKPETRPSRQASVQKEDSL